MKVRIYYGGCEDKISDLIDNLDIELQRVPNQGESLSLWVGDYWLDTKIKQVFTHYSEPGNPHVKYHGDTYAVYVEDVMIVERFTKNK